MSAEALAFEPVYWEGKPSDLPILHDRQVHYRMLLAGGAVLDVFAYIRSNSQQIVIAGQDALNPQKPPLPYFARWSWYPDLPCSFVTFNDPTLYRSDEMLGGWCQFDAHHFGVEMIADALNELLSAANLSTSDSVLYGSSAGGFWALMTGALLPEAAVVSDIAQTNLLTYPPVQHVRRLFDVAYAGIPHEVVKERFAHRLDVARYYAHVGKRPNRIFYHQNSLDIPHVETQMRPFLEAMTPFGVVEARTYERTVPRGTHCPRDKPGSIAAMLEPLTVAPSAVPVDRVLAVGAAG
jgi:hypothetical protein